MCEHIKKEEELCLLSLGGHSFIAIPSCNRFLVLDFFLCFKLSKRTLKLFHQLRYSLSMGMLEGG